MKIKIESPTRKRVLIGAIFALTTLYLALAAAHFLADWLASRPDQHRLLLATKLDPWNADYAYRLGRYYDLVVNNPSAALGQYRRATLLNPRDSRYWLALADSYQLLGDVPSQASAIEQAILHDPKHPDVAWEAANLYLVQGEDKKALKEFRTLMEGTNDLTPQALQLCWRIQPDVDSLLQHVIPPQKDTYQAFLDLLMSKQQTDGVIKVTDSLFRLHQPVELPRVFEYMSYLLGHKAVDGASRVWRQATSLLGLSTYLSSSNNLIVNGDFSLPVLNGGFDWQYRQQSSVSLTLDPRDFHSGPRSLSIVFDGPGIEEAGVYQLIPVQPETTYEFSGYYKNEDIEGAGGPHLALQDFYTGQSFYESEELRDGVAWKNVSGEFTTGPDTRLLILRVQRLPAGSAIRGRLWIDDLRLLERSAERAQ